MSNAAINIRSYPQCHVFDHNLQPSTFCKVIKNSPDVKHIQRIPLPTYVKTKQHDLEQPWADALTLSRTMDYYFVKFH